MKHANIKMGRFYIGGESHRIREVIDANEVWVDWRDIDPETVDNVPLLQVKGQCSPKTFAAWAKRKVEPEEVRERLAMPKAERIRLSQGLPRREPDDLK
jgi:hypothetical protein